MLRKPAPGQAKFWGLPFLSQEFSPRGVWQSRSGPEWFQVPSLSQGAVPAPPEPTLFQSSWAGSSWAPSGNAPAQVLGLATIQPDFTIPEPLAQEVGEASWEFMVSLGPRNR